MRLIFTLVIITSLLPVCSQRTFGQVDLQETLDRETAIRLSENYLRVARFASMTEPITTDAIKASLILIQRAVQLTPENESVWRSYIEIASMADRPDLMSEGIKGLLLISQQETTVQLARLRDAINQIQTAPQRIEVYEQLLSEQSRQSIDPRVLARIAYDEATLQRQLGDIGQFARLLAESVALDPSNPETMSLAAGFFGDDSADCYRRAELLASAVLSNLLDITTQISLAEFLMSYGDYGDARALYDIILSDGAGNVDRISDGLLADIVLSQWADGDPIAGLDALLTRQIEVDKSYRDNIKIQQPRMSPLELARIHAPLVPKLSAVRAALYAELGEPTQSAISLEAAVETLHILAQIYVTAGGNSLFLAGEAYIQAAFLTLWLGGDVEIAAQIIEVAEQYVIVEEQEIQKLEGWIAFRRGDVDLALSLLSPLVGDPAAELGVAMAYKSKGNTAAAANHLLEVARMNGGTMIGVWAKERLRELVQQDFDLREEVNDLRSLMKGVLKTIRSFSEDPRPPFSLRVSPTKQTFAAYEPILVNIEIKNNTAVPLAINRTGPIQPLLLIEAILDIPSTDIKAMPSILIPIDRQLNIPPRGTISLQADLRQHWVGTVLNQFPTKGASIHLRSTANFSARESSLGRQKRIVYDLGRFGVRHESDYFRVDGCRLTNVWLSRAINQIQHPETIEDLTAFVLMTFVIQDDVLIRVVKPLITPEEEENPLTIAPDGRLSLQDDAITTILSAFPRLDNLEQAWVIAMMSDDPSIEALTGMINDPEDIDYQFSWLSRFVSPLVPDEALDDTMVLLALESENESVKDSCKMGIFLDRKGGCLQESTTARQHTVGLQHHVFASRYHTHMLREEVAKRISETAILHGEFTLRSGRKSTWYIDKYLFSTQPDILQALGEMFAEMIPETTTLLAGAELGGIPLVTATALSSNLPCIFIRNQKKEYGTANQMEGRLQTGDKVVIIEDIATTGGQVLEAAQTIQMCGASVDAIIAVIDRAEGARENIEGAGFEFHSLFTTEDLDITENVPK